MEDNKHASILTSIVTVLLIILGIYMAFDSIQNLKNENICDESYGSKKYKIIGGRLYCVQQKSEHTIFVKPK